MKTGQAKLTRWHLDSKHRGNRRCLAVLTISVPLAFSPRSKWPVTHTGIMKAQRCSYTFFYEKSRQSRPGRTPLSVQIELHTWRREADVIWRSHQLFAGNARYQRHHHRGRHGNYEFPAALRTKHIQISTSTMDEGPTLRACLRRMSPQGAIHLGSKTVNPTKCLKLLG